MKLRLMINSFIGLLILVVVCMAAPQAHAQNQTPANVAPVGWTDPDTGLTWTKTDNGADINWYQANAYCTNLRLGGYTDWRLPTIDELQGIYDPGSDVPGQWNGSATTWHVKGNLKLSSVPWSSSSKNAKEAWYINFDNGERRSNLFGNSGYVRARCVRR
jgi:hypothetical protein